ncbi:MAG: LysM peptidoglycan-binding domain-containing protein [Sulfobacillus sp.]|nr:LysM peptidoglycan-binding domain-containing protein [Sulfobacillus sp.]
MKEGSLTVSRYPKALAGLSALGLMFAFAPLADAASLTGIYGPGATGSSVALLQTELTRAGYPVPATGYFGPITENAVRSFQSAHGLVVDGWVGPATEAALASTGTLSGSQTTNQYTVQVGDTLFGIAQKFHTTVDTLVSLNHLANPNWLMVGQTLTVPAGLSASAFQPAVTTSGGTQSPSGTENYVVQAGNTLAGIAALFHTSWQNLATLNHLGNPNLIWVGETLTVPAGNANPAANPPTSASVSLPVEAAPMSSGQAIASLALKYLGVPYVWGGASPSTGFDCSGLVQYVLGQVGIPIGRTTWAQYADVTKIPVSQLAPGDLVFFSTYAPGASHVGIYIGSYPALGYQAAFVDAPAPGQSVMVQNFNNPYWQSHFIGAGTP